MKLVRIIPVILLAFLMVSAVAASEDANATKVKFQGVEFMIPDGFNQSKDDESFDDLGSDGTTCFYVNETDGEIVITVIKDWMGMNIDELYKEGAKKGKIKGHEGWKYDEDDLHVFGYVDGDIGIIVAASNKTLLSQVIV